MKTKLIKLFSLLAIFAASVSHADIDWTTGDRAQNIATAEALLEPIPFKYLPYGVKMYDAAQVDELVGRVVTNSIPGLMTDNVIIGWMAYGDDVVLEPTFSTNSWDCAGAPQHGNVAVGYAATNRTTHGVAIGKWSESGEFGAEAIGYAAKALGHHTLAIGRGAFVPRYSYNCTVINGHIGNIEDTEGNGGIYNTVIGADIGEGNQHCTVIGHDARIENIMPEGMQTNIVGATVIGYGTATYNNQIVINGRDFTAVLDRLEEIERQLGIISEAADQLYGAIEGVEPRATKDGKEPVRTLEDFLKVVKEASAK